MAVDQGLVDWIAEALAPMGELSMRRMMGGATLYLDGTIFALTGDDGLWFKADAESDATWDAAGCGRFTYEMPDRTATMNYRRAPDEVYDDPDAMREWATLALAAGLRAPKKPVRKTTRPARGS
jgi:DNA transformation protein and related proteins